MKYLTDDCFPRWVMELVKGNKEFDERALAVKSKKDG